MQSTTASTSSAEKLTFPCSACGADLEFAIGSSTLKCPFCGHTETIPQSGDPIVERPFESYESLGLSRGWGGAELKELRCDTCGAAFNVEPQVTSVDCPFCGSSQVATQEARQDLLRPESLVPFAISKDEVKDRFRDWIRKLWFRPNALKRLAVADRILGIYIPHWTFDALTQSYWRAEAGYYYYETETYETTDAEGNTTLETRQVQKIRWEWTSGSHTGLFDDVLVPASKGIDRALAGRLSFDTSALVPYQPQYLVGLGAEDYQIDMPEAWPDAKSQIDSAVRSACDQLVPGDTHRNLSVETSYHNRTFKLCLLPLWVSSYLYGGKSYRFLCNGQSGEVQGDAPISWLKVVSALTIIAAIITLIILLSN